MPMSQQLMYQPCVDVSAVRLHSILNPLRLTWAGGGRISPQCAFFLVPWGGDGGGGGGHEIEDGERRHAEEDRDDRKPHVHGVGIPPILVD